MRWRVVGRYKLLITKCIVDGKRWEIVGAYLEGFSFFGSTAGVVTALVAGVEYPLLVA
jgi:hypothetical protein